VIRVAKKEEREEKNQKSVSVAEKAKAKHVTFAMTQPFCWGFH
jgi:hypothetical protein